MFLMDGIWNFVTRDTIAKIAWYVLDADAFDKRQKIMRDLCKISPKWSKILNSSTFQRLYYDKYFEENWDDSKLYEKPGRYPIRKCQVMEAQLIQMGYFPRILNRNLTIDDKEKQRIKQMIRLGYKDPTNAPVTYVAPQKLTTQQFEMKMVETKTLRYKEIAPYGWREFTEGSTDARLDKYMSQTLELTQSHIPMNTNQYNLLQSALSYEEPIVVWDLFDAQCEAQCEAQCKAQCEAQCKAQCEAQCKAQCKTQCKAQCEAQCQDDYKDVNCSEKDIEIVDLFQSIPKSTKIEEYLKNHKVDGALLTKLWATPENNLDRFEFLQDCNYKVDSIVWNNTLNWKYRDNM